MLSTAMVFKDVASSLTLPVSTTLVCKSSLIVPLLCVFTAERLSRASLGSLVVLITVFYPNPAAEEVSFCVSSYAWNF